MKVKAATSVPWITTPQADKLYVRAKALLAACDNLVGTDLMPADYETKRAMVSLRQLFLELDDQ